MPIDGEAYIDADADPDATPNPRSVDTHTVLAVIEKLRATKDIRIEEPILYVKMQIAAFKLEKGKPKGVQETSGRGEDCT
ncbi:hypothetical protein KFK09_001298 [Dendrobium nobile]|uniref:Uncharacterized protein n=1 Tax=Dendrobium nobile TaxID=94219 RepID=A0A8T3C4F9_DENNO|nr:hypothetical protein KFK09_001298 [Dendrobium nobile]